MPSDCTTQKTAYATKAIAKNAAKWMASRAGKRFGVERCGVCGKWHVRQR